MGGVENYVQTRDHDRPAAMQARRHNGRSTSNSRPAEKEFQQRQQLAANARVNIPVSRLNSRMNGVADLAETVSHQPSGPTRDAHSHVYAQEPHRYSDHKDAFDDTDAEAADDTTSIASFSVQVKDSQPKTKLISFGTDYNNISQNSLLQFVTLDHFHTMRGTVDSDYSSDDVVRSIDQRHSDDFADDGHPRGAPTQEYDWDSEAHEARNAYELRFEQYAHHGTSIPPGYDLSDDGLMQPMQNGRHTSLPDSDRQHPRSRTAYSVPAGDMESHQTYSSRKTLPQQTLSVRGRPLQPGNFDLHSTPIQRCRHGKEIPSTEPAFLSQPSHAPDHPSGSMEIDQAAFRSNSSPSTRKRIPQHHGEPDRQPERGQSHDEALLSVNTHQPALKISASTMNTLSPLYDDTDSPTQPSSGTSQNFNGESNPRKRHLELDYGPAELSKLSYPALYAQSFDTYAGAQKAITAPEQGPVHPTSLPEKLATLSTMSQVDRQQVFSDLPLSEWEDCGDWFLEQFGILVTKMRDARKERRKVAQQFEEEIRGRWDAVDAKRKALGKGLDDMKAGGMGLLAGRALTPGRSEASGSVA